MRTPSEIYEEYRIPPWLQEHQLRVAATAKLICGVRQEANEREAVLLGLFHDMGNILKFDLSPQSQLKALVGDDAAYWQSVKDDFTTRYGESEYAATAAIAKEIALLDSVVSLLEKMSYSRTDVILEEGPIELQICSYADMRIGPYGVLPLKDRIADLKTRASKRWKPETAKEQEAAFVENLSRFFAIEKIVFEGAHLQPEDISDASIAPLMEELKKYEVS